MAAGDPATLPKPPGPEAGDRLDSWKEIAAYLKRDESTVRRWQKEGLPVHRHPHKRKATVYAYRSEIDGWWSNGHARLETAPPPTARHMVEVYVSRLRKALGARRRDIMWQILTESTTLSPIGGLIGTVRGFALAVGVEAFTPLPAAIETWSVALGIGMTSTVGLFFGLYPAMRAASLDPIEALRRE